MNSTNETEVVLSEYDLIVSMTDVKGFITYVNDVFCEVASFSREELIGKPHNIVRHKDMPKVIFKLLWETLLRGKPISAFVKNATKDGNYYWVKAYVAPVFTEGEITHLTSYRRPVSNFAKQEISKLYKHLKEYEATHSLDETYTYLMEYLKERNISYDQFVDRLASEHSISNADALKIDIDSYYIDHMIFKTNIARSVALGKKDIKVTDSCCCNFGKKLKQLESMPFTSHPLWSQVHHYHNHVHGLMKDYVQRAGEDASKSELEGILSNVDKDTNKLIGTLKNVIDTYVEEGISHE
ncbi:MAG: PAS domain S-box protein [Sulfurimonas sp.]|nr:PAS domain S-box protein [Sulfurimonas sp.]MDD5202516.1 PAS domain S-box protein [Sulfurimonas sp.]